MIRRGCRVFPYKFKRLGVKNSEPTEKRLKELVRDRGLVNEMRKRLADPSWFKRQLLLFAARSRGVCHLQPPSLVRIRRRPLLFRVFVVAANELDKAVIKCIDLHFNTEFVLPRHQGNIL